MEEEKHPLDERKVRFKPNMLGSRRQAVVWIISITFTSFFISAFLSYISVDILKAFNIWMSFLILFIIIIVNLVSDLIGTAVTAADETPFHAMASRKIYGARQSIKLIRNADKVSNLCNDVIGDICGIISGVAIAYISIRLVTEIYGGVGGAAAGAVNGTVAGIVLTGFVTALTVGGKALTKNIAIKHSNFVVYKCSEIIQFIKNKR